MARIPVPDLMAFCAKLLAAHGVDEEQARNVAENLVWSECVGRRNFGLLRLPVYLERVASGAIKCPCSPRFENLGPSLGLLDGDDGFGQHAGMLAMKHAIELARGTGVGAVGVRNSNFFGTGAYFTHQAADAGMIGLAMSNSFPKVTAHGGLGAVFGTNPFAFGAPRRNGETLMVDMATSGLAGSTVRQHITSGEPLPEGLAVDVDGAPITDPEKVGGGALLPFGGAKGYGLSLMVEILAGVLTGAGVTHGVASMYKDKQEPGHNGHFLIAIDVSRFMPMEAYYDRFEAMVADIRASAPDGGEVLLPGEMRWREYAEAQERGIELSPTTIEAVSPLAAVTDAGAPWR